MSDDYLADVDVVQARLSGIYDRVARAQLNTVNTAMLVVGDLAEIGVGVAATPEGGVGIPAVLHGFDRLQAHWRSYLADPTGLSGYIPSHTEEFVTAVTGSPTAGHLVDEGLAIGLTAFTPFVAERLSVAISTAEATPQIYGSRGGSVDAVKVDQIKQDMLTGNYRFTSAEGRIGIFLDQKGRVMIGEGHHRMVGALESGDPENVRLLLQNARTTVVTEFPTEPLPLPPKR